MKYACLLFLMHFACANMAEAQTNVVSGRVTDSLAQGVSGANVLLKRQGSGSIAFFKTTRSDGEYRFALADTITTSNYYLEVTHLTYEQATAKLIDGQSVYNFTLAARVNKIPQINVGRRPRITQDGDTLRYDVQSFAETMDRSIGDVLKRMPGVEVADNGRITFQGQAISNLYIDGDDLLEGKYGIGTKAIPHVMVKGVEVLKNHQPIKVLKDRVVSRDIAINLVIQDEAKLKLSGDVELGGGLPEQYVAVVNTMLFNKKHKLLNVLKGNNTGDDLQADIEDLVGGNSSGAIVHKLLSTGTTGDPGLPKSRYYLNNSGGIFTNNLVNLPSEWQLKSNIDFFIDRNRMDYTSRSTVFTATDSVSFSEGLHRIREPVQLDVNLRANKNVASKYLSNDLKLTYRADGTDASLLSNAVGMQQSLSQQQWRLSNVFRYVPLLHNNHVLNINWRLNGYKLPETLGIIPGSAVSVIDTSGTSLTQHADMQALGTKVDLEYILKPGLIRQRYTASLSQDWQALGSSMWLDGMGNAFGSERGNDLRWRKTAAMAAGSYYYEQRGLKVSLYLPVSQQRIAYHDPVQGLNQSQADFLFMPMFYTVVSLGGSNEVEARYSRSNTFGDLTTVYRGAILTNYRTLVNNDGVLQERHGDNISLKYTGGNPVSMLFFNAGYTYSVLTANTITAVEMSDRESRLIQLPFKNTAVNHQVNAEISKFIFFLGAKSGLQVSWRKGEQDQLINGDLLPYLNQSLSLMPDFNVKLFGKVQLAYRGHLTWYRNAPAGTPAGAAVDFYQRLFTAGHTMYLTYSPNSVTHMGASGQHLLTTQRGNPDRNYVFADAYVRYKVVKWRTEFELNLTNIADVQRFGYVMFDANASYESSYDIRGRMLLLKALFNF